MTGQTTLVFDIASVFDEKVLADLLTKSKAQCLRPSDQNQLEAWQLDGLKIVRYAKKLVVQGKINQYQVSFLHDLSSIEGLILDDKNADIFVKVVPKRQNAIVCPECRATSLIIEAAIEGLNIVFRKECNHSDKMRPPLHMLNNRILPDVSILVSKVLSKLIDLGYFVGFEILVPQFVMNIVDHIGSTQKAAVSDELTVLKQLENKNKVSVKHFEDGYELPANADKVQEEEDNMIIDIADLTNSILVTEDGNMKDKALIKNRPVIFIKGEILQKIKVMHDVRMPS